MEMIKNVIEKKRNWQKRIKEVTHTQYFSMLMFAIFWNINPYRLYKWVRDNEDLLRNLELYKNNTLQVEQGYLHIDTLEKYCKETGEVIDILVDNLSKREVQNV